MRYVITGTGQILVSACGQALTITPTHPRYEIIKEIVLADGNEQDVLENAKIEEVLSYFNKPWDVLGTLEDQGGLSSQMMQDKLRDIEPW
jgi:hypothetical protein